MYFTRQSLILPGFQPHGPGMGGRVLKHPVLPPWHLLFYFHLSIPSIQTNNHSHIRFYFYFYSRLLYYCTLFYQNKLIRISKMLKIPRISKMLTRRHYYILHYTKNTVRGSLVVFVGNFNRIFAPFFSHFTHV